MARKTNLSTAIVIRKAYEIVQAGDFNDLSYRGLARELNVQPQTLYRYVANIEELQIKVVLVFLNQLIDYAQDAVIGLSGEEAILAFARAIFEFSEQNHSLNSMLTLVSKIKDHDEIVAKIMELRDIPTKILQRSSSDPSKLNQHVQILMSLIFGFIEFTDLGLYRDKEKMTETLIAGMKEAIVNW
ncbi:Transcriptional regulator, TetR family [Pediococcus damnosus]|uniref:Transcriptional regulator, TetR family n=1 Tax=Pediococcus damnosus TaxID=51663 RepID=A0A0R2HJX6_9LACO|nr:TetR/AcrR family transcriptional regulator [Pediococcus damnosus]AMV60394.1 Transcriptional regulator, TetR family [Pediococcus damnosus]AMV63205.1 Transcriptional regulator, TetR family [Pediococcus damnosus]AMV64644.1 Transcriptional regulator, TetR family [Pediococcus damnosus]AMV66900.1 Transcriptional regulator, TetR family [Pediococcus damnosus]AMV69495.1 Transcriptional regulator, TetR family [Pediococcus damnosus]